MTHKSKITPATSPLFCNRNTTRFTFMEVIAKLKPGTYRLF